MAKLEPYNFRGWEFLVNKDVGYAPYFSQRIRKRIHEKRATNIVVSGEAGIGKSYLAIDIARILEGITRGGNERFKIEQVVFTYKQYMKLLLKLKMGKVIVFDEPSYAMSHREWYKELNKVLVHTIESQRFKVHPLIIPIINKALLDKTVRTYLLQFQIEMRDRGKAVVYRMYPSQHYDKLYRYTFCYLDYEMLDIDKCDRDSCLDCPKIDKCQIFRAKYERKKATTQEDRYKTAYDMAIKRESKRLTNRQIAKKLYPLRKQYFDQETGKIDVALMRIIAQDKLDIKLGHSKSYDIRTLLEYLHPKDFT